MSAAFVTDGAVMEAILRGPDGMVVRSMIERAQRVEDAAKAQIHDVSGCLSGSIVKRVEDIDGETCVRIIADTAPCSPTRTSYALYVHEGTQAHVIQPKGLGVLAFEWPNGFDGDGLYFFAGPIHHPGTQANRYFTDNLGLAVV